MGSERATAHIVMKHAWGAALHKQGTGKMEMLTLLLLLPSTCPPSATVIAISNPFPLPLTRHSALVPQTQPKGTGQKLCRDRDGEHRLCLDKAFLRWPLHSHSLFLQDKETEEGVRLPLESSFGWTLPWLKPLTLSEIWGHERRCLWLFKVSSHMEIRQALLDQLTFKHCADSVAALLPPHGQPLSFHSWKQFLLTLQPGCCTIAAGHLWGLTLAPRKRWASVQAGSFNPISFNSFSSNKMHLQPAFKVSALWENFWHKKFHWDQLPPSKVVMIAGQITKTKCISPLAGHVALLCHASFELAHRQTAEVKASSCKSVHDRPNR